MNKPLSDSDLATPMVTTGPIAGSRKIFSVPDAAPDLRVPLREIPLTEGSGEEPVRVYDPSGPYTDNDALIDVEKGGLAVTLGELLRPGEVRMLKRRLRGVIDPTWRFPEPTSAWSVPWPPV